MQSHSKLSSMIFLKMKLYLHALRVAPSYLFKKSNLSPSYYVHLVELENCVPNYKTNQPLYIVLLFVSGAYPVLKYDFSEYGFQLVP